MKKHVVTGKGWTYQFDSIQVEKEALHCRKEIGSEGKVAYVEMTLRHGYEIEFTDDDLDVIVSIPVDNVKSINTVGNED